MPRRAMIAATPMPRTRESLAEDLAALGVRPGMTLLVHSSLRSIGWVCGGAVAVVQALMDVLTDQGTLVMPTHSANLSAPERWVAPPVPKEWIPIIRASMPAYDPAVTPTWFMGRIPELFRTMPGVARSGHPAVSFAAWGRFRSEVTDGHGIDFGLGESSPLARIYDLDGSVLLLGVGYEVNTSFHLAEHRAGIRRIVQEAAPIMQGGERYWRTYDDIEYDDEAFEEIGEAFERTGAVRNGRVGSAASRLFSQRAAVDFAVDWLRANCGRGA